MSKNIQIIRLILFFIIGFTANPSYLKAACLSLKFNQDKIATLSPYNPVIAHRGAWKKNKLPENSIASLRHAINLKCTGSEFDVRMTKDDSLIIIHDAKYNNLEIEKTTYNELIPYRLSNGEKLPTLREYINEGIRNNNSTLLVCEIKPSQISNARSNSVAANVIKLAERLNAAGKMVFISFDYNILKTIIKLSPNVATQYLEGNMPPEKLKSDMIGGADYHFSAYKSHPEWIVNARVNNTILNAWTVNNILEMDWLLANKFDYITTDEPELLFERIKQSPVTKGMKLVWADEFNYSGLPDSLKWSYDTQGNASSWGNNELQFYTANNPENVKVENGSMFITALKKAHAGRNYTSARLITKGKGDWLYGRIEVRAKLPDGRGLWPAIWMLPTDWAYGNWPDSGEIDIMENVGYDPDTIVGSAHTKSYNHMIGTHKNAKISVPDNHEQFHTYVLEWEAHEYRIYVDEKHYFTFRNEGTGWAEWPFDKRFHLILNVAVGGNWGGKMGIDDSVFPQHMEVDYVRIFQEIKQ